MQLNFVLVFGFVQFGTQVVHAELTGRLFLAFEPGEQGVVVFQFLFAFDSQPPLNEFAILPYFVLLVAFRVVIDSVPCNHFVVKKSFKFAIVVLLNGAFAVPLVVPELAFVPCIVIVEVGAFALPHVVFEIAYVDFPFDLELNPESMAFVSVPVSFVFVSIREVVST